MAYVITERCIGVMDRACVDVCPVSCIYEGEDQLYIHSGDCIECGACEPACPVAAIFPEDEIPPRWQEFVAKSAKFFSAHPGAKTALPRKAGSR